MITDVLKQARDKMAPDRRTAVFTVHGEAQGDVVLLTGEIQSLDMKRDLLAFLKSHGITHVTDSIVVLPHRSVGDKTRGVVSLSVANIRKQPEHSAEMVTQALLGAPVKVLKKEHGWILVQTPDEYLGWTDDNIIEMAPDAYQAWLARPKVIITADYVSVRNTKEGKNLQVSDAVAGGILAVKSDAGTHVEVEFPDLRTGFVRKEDVQSLQEFLARANATPESIVATAKRFLGVPYFWGGTSGKGLDCSGFTKTVYFLNGVQLPRDASQQAYVGMALDTSGDINLEPGDLLFFGFRAKDDRKERVTHTAISLGGKRFIHSSGLVSVNSLDPKDPDFSEYRLKSFLWARRMIGAPEQTGIRYLTNIPYYTGKP